MVRNESIRKQFGLGKFEHLMTNQMLRLGIYCTVHVRSIIQNSTWMIFSAQHLDAYRHANSRSKSDTIEAELENALLIRVTINEADK